jgi:hypothetical protein
MKKPEFSTLAIDEIFQIDFFSEVGIYNETMPEKFILIDNKLEVEKLILLDDWAAYREEKSAEVTSYLNNKDINFYNEYWNVFVRRFKEIWNTKLESKISNSLLQKNLASEILIQVRWDLLNYVMVQSYQSLKPPKFFLELFNIYQLGHLPCGVNDSKNKDFNFLIY